MQECSVAAPYGGSLYRESQCTEYPVQKPVKKCAEVPKQTCVKRRLAPSCREVTKHICRQDAMSIAIKGFYRK